MTNEVEESTEPSDTSLIDSNFGDKTWERLTTSTVNIGESSSAWDVGLRGDLDPAALETANTPPLADTDELSSFLSGIKPQNHEVDNQLEFLSSSHPSSDLAYFGVTPDFADILLQHGEFPASPPSSDETLSCATGPSTVILTKTLLSVGSSDTEVEGRKTTECILDGDTFKEELSTERISTLNQEDNFMSLRKSSSESKCQNMPSTLTNGSLRFEHIRDESLCEDQELPKRESQSLSLGPGQSPLFTKNNSHLQQRHHPYPKPPPPPTPTPAPTPTTTPPATPAGKPSPKSPGSKDSLSRSPMSPRLRLLRTVATEDTSLAFRSHPLFPLLRDLVVTELHFSSASAASSSFPIASLLSRLPTTTEELIKAFYLRNADLLPGGPDASGPAPNNLATHCTIGLQGHGIEAATSPAVEAVMLDALQYAHKRLLEKINAKQSSLMSPDPWDAVERQAAAQRAYNERTKKTSGTHSREPDAAIELGLGSIQHDVQTITPAAAFTETFTISDGSPGAPLLLPSASCLTSKTFQGSQPPPTAAVSSQPQLQPHSTSPLTGTTPKPTPPLLTPMPPAYSPSTGGSDSDSDPTTSAKRDEGTEASAILPRQQHERISNKAAMELTTWLCEDSNYPFPTDTQTGLQKRPVNNWL